MPTLHRPTIKQLSQRYKRLPEEVIDALYSEELSELLSTLQDNYSLSDAQRGFVAIVTGRTMMGLFPLKDFVRNIQKYAEIDTATAKEIASEINEQIFQPIREELMAVHGVGPQKGRGAGKRGEEGRDEDAGTTSPQNERAPTASNQSGGNEESQDEVAKRRREELLERLRNNGSQSSSGPTETNNTTPATPEEPEQTPPDTAAANGKKLAVNGSGDSEEPKEPQKSDDAPSGPRATTAAWNGKKIDLSQVPPRRRAPESRSGDKKSKNNDTNRHVRLKKGSDGFYYEV